MRKLRVGAAFVAVVLLLQACAARALPDGIYALTQSKKLAVHDYVPLILEGAPTTDRDPNGRTLLSVTLAPSQTRALEVFSRAHLGGSVAVVLDGQIITTHKMRSVIQGGKMQLTRCGDDRCSVIYSKLLSRHP